MIADDMLRKDKIGKIMNLLNHLESFLSFMFLVALFGVVCMGVFYRYVLNTPLLWNDELSRFIFIFMVMFGAAEAVRTKSHIAINFIVSSLPKKYREIIELLIYFLIIFFLVNLIYWGILFSIRLRLMGTPAMRIPWIYVYLIIPFTASSMCVRYVLETINKLMVLLSNSNSHR